MIEDIILDVSNQGLRKNSKFWLELLDKHHEKIRLNDVNRDRMLIVHRKYLSDHRLSYAALGREYGISSASIRVGILSVNRDLIREEKREL